AAGELDAEIRPAQHGSDGQQHHQGEAEEIPDPPPGDDRDDAPPRVEVVAEAGEGRGHRLCSSVSSAPSGPSAPSAGPGPPAGSGPSVGAGPSPGSRPSAAPGPAAAAPAAAPRSSRARRRQTG